MEFLGMCIFLATWLVCDTWIFLSGYEALFFKAKTDEEKELHKAIITNSKNVVPFKNLMQTVYGIDKNGLIKHSAVAK
jgi:hypothetical protein